MNCWRSIYFFILFVFEIEGTKLESFCICQRLHHQRWKYTLQCNSADREWDIMLSTVFCFWPCSYRFICEFYNNKICSKQLLINCFRFWRRELTCPLYIHILMFKNTNLLQIKLWSNSKFLNSLLLISKIIRCWIGYSDCFYLTRCSCFFFQVGNINYQEVIFTAHPARQEGSGFMENFKSPAYVVVSIALACAAVFVVAFLVIRYRKTTKSKRRRQTVSNVLYLPGSQIEFDSNSTPDELYRLNPIANCENKLLFRFFPMQICLFKLIDRITCMWSRFQCLFPNPNWLVWKGIPLQKTRSNFPWDRYLPYGD